MRLAYCRSATPDTEFGADLVALGARSHYDIRSSQLTTLVRGAYTGSAWAIANTLRAVFEYIE
ncbi:hypothetical protein GCM10027563_26170 [Parasphingorhabdus pacifica]